MKLKKAETIIKDGLPKGFRVWFEVFIEPEIQTPDFFPELDEKLIETEEKAWELAQKFAEKTVNYCINIIVVDESLTPVSKEKRIRNVAGI